MESNVDESGDFFQTKRIKLEVVEEDSEEVTVKEEEDSEDEVTMEEENYENNVNNININNGGLNEIVANDLRNCTGMEINLRPQHSTQLMDNINDLRLKQAFCDIDLIASDDGRKIPAHRVVLIGASKYFKAMFYSGMTDCGKKEISLENITGKALAILVHYCYTGLIKIDRENIEELLPAASQLEFEEIEKQCSIFIKYYLVRNPLHCVSYYAVAKLYNFVGVQQVAERLMQKHFMDIKDTPEFQEMDFNLLHKLIKSDYLNVQHEEDVFKCVIKWTIHKKIERNKHLVDFMKIIRFGQMEVDFIIKQVVEFLIQNNLKEINEEILQYKYDSNFQPRLLSEFSLIPRKTLKKPNPTFTVLIVSDFQLKAKTYSSTGLQTLQTTRISLRDSIFAIIEWQKIWFCFQNDGGIRCVDTVTSVTRRLSHSSILRKNCTVIEHKDFIYVIGGMTIENDAAFNLITQYNLKSNIWSNFAYLSVCIADPIAAITNDKLYCIGRSAMTFVSIDLHTKDFTKLDAPHDMPNIRQMIAYEGDLYAASDECVQKYDTLTREWSKMAKCPPSGMVLSNRRTNEIISVTGYVRGNKLLVRKYCAFQNQWVAFFDMYINNPDEKFFLLQNY